MMAKLFLSFKSISILTICFLFTAPCHAYIDPGTGSAIFYLVSGIVVSTYFAIRGLYYRLINTFFRLRYRSQTCAIAIHCEDPRYEITFLPILVELSNRNIDVTFFTMYERNDPTTSLPPDVAHRSIPPGLIGYAYLNNLEATVLVTTTPQLEVMTFRRSPRVKHYTIVSHALGESRYVRPFAYDYYDSVLCCGPTLKKNVRKIEEIRNLPAKLLLETGIPHYQELIRAAKLAPPLGQEPVVLVAPSWGPLSMFEAFGTDFIKEIAKHYQVIVRPHPQMKVSQKALYQEILGLDGVTVDTEVTPAEAMSKAHILLSDISGITHEFAFIYERPVLIIDREQATGGLEGELLGGDSELKRRCKSFIVPVPPSEINLITAHIRTQLSSHSRENIQEVRDALVYNFSNGAKTAACQIEQLYHNESAKAGDRKGLINLIAGLPASMHKALKSNV